MSSIGPMGEKPDLAWVPVEACYVDGNYQRPIRGGLIKRILSGFSWAKFGALVLARQDDGRFAVVEGQHRWHAAKLAGLPEVPAVVLPQSGMEFEAAAFIGINRDRQAVTAVEQYWAGLTAGDAGARRVADVLARAGCDVVPEPGSAKPGLTSAVGAVTRSCDRYGEAATKTALVIIRAAWPTDAHALRGTLITALARLARANAGAEFQDGMIAALRGQSFAQLTAHAEGFRKLSGGSAETALCKALVELHNKGKRVNVIAIGVAA